MTGITAGTDLSVEKSKMAQKIGAYFKKMGLPSDIGLSALTFNTRNNNNGEFNGYEVGVELSAKKTLKLDILTSTEIIVDGKTGKTKSDFETATNVLQKKGKYHSDKILSFS